MREQPYVLQNTQVTEQETSKVLRNTYALLAMTLGFSGLVAFAAQQANVPHPNMLITLVGFYGLFFLTTKLRDSGWGLLSTFALTGFMGYTLGPILNRYLGMSNGADLIVSAFTMTAIVFGGLSAYVLTTRKNMSFLSGFITVGFFVLLGATAVRDQRPAAGDQRRLRAVLLGGDPLADQRDHPRRGAQLHHGDHQPVRIDLQPVPQPAADPRHHGPRRLIPIRAVPGARHFGGLFRLRLS